MRSLALLSGTALVLYGTASCVTALGVPLGRPASAEAKMIAASAAAEPGMAPAASGFTLADQYNRWHTYGFPRQKVSFLVLADQAGASQLEAWVQPLYARYQDAIEIHGVAALPAVPGAMRGLVRLFFKSRLDYPVMLDWESRVAQQYGYHQTQAHVFVIDPAGSIRLSVVGPAEPGQLQRVFATIDDLLQRPCRSVQESTCQRKEP